MDEMRLDTAPVDGPTDDFGEGDRIDLEAHVRLEAGLIDRSPVTKAVSAAPAPSSISPPGRPLSTWQTIKRFFGGSER